MLTVEEVAKALPPTLKMSATQQLTDQINNIIQDPLVAEQIRENFIGYTSVLKDGKFKTEDYLLAVTFVSFKLMNYSDKESYEKTFPQRMNTLIAKGTSKKDIAAYVSAYRRGKLVNLIMEQTLVPTWVLNQDAYQKAINTQVDLMKNSASDLVRTQAANSILTHLKKPEVKDFQISIESKENSGMRELQAQLGLLAGQQLKLIEAGVSTREIAAQPLIEAEYAEVAPD